jgi:hypothetical protein
MEVSVSANHFSLLQKSFSVPGTEKNRNSVEIDVAAVAVAPRHSA